METTKILEQLQELNDVRSRNQKSAREDMLIAAQALVVSLQTTSEFIVCSGVADPARLMCLRIAVDLKIFESLDKAGSRGATIAELAQPTEADPILIARIMKHLAATHIVLELSPGTFAHSTISSQFTQPQHASGIIFNSDIIGPSFGAMPAYFAQHNFNTPTGTLDRPFQFAHKTELGAYPWLAANPSYHKVFNNYMAGYGEGRYKWFQPDFYPIQKQLVAGFDASSNAPFLVDLGGGKGHDLIALATEHKDLPGRLVLEDQAAVISSIDPPLPTGLEAIAHNFFTPQPESCRGARAYFMHSVIHNWDDESAIEILKALKPALIPGYSKVLIHDLLVPDIKTRWSTTAFDWAMGAIQGMRTRERTEAEFRTLFDAAGLEIQNIWVYDQGTEALIELVLPA